MIVHDLFGSRGSIHLGPYSTSWGFHQSSRPKAWSNRPSPTNDPGTSGPEEEGVMAIYRFSQGKRKEGGVHRNSAKSGKGDAKDQSRWSIRCACGRCIRERGRCPSRGGYWGNGKSNCHTARWELMVAFRKYTQTYLVCPKSWKIGYIEKSRVHLVMSGYW